jgi:hypothetical protein
MLCDLWLTYGSLILAFLRTLQEATCVRLHSANSEHFAMGPHSATALGHGSMEHDLPVINRWTAFNVPVTSESSGNPVHGE